MAHATRPSLLILLATLAPLARGQQVSPQTRAERTDYKETSLYEDVIGFVETLKARGAPLSMEYIGTSPSGRKIPMVVAARPLPADRAEARRLNRSIVCIQANIHAGEVEGKEAVLMLLRDLSAAPQGGGLLEKLVLIVLPIYNIDGNEKLGPQSRNRRHQLGPEQVGMRYNGQGLDLNRDYVKLEAPETRAVAEHVFTTWDPDVFVDLHATNGTLHGYQLTYSPPLHPDTVPCIQTYARDELLIEGRKAMHARYGLHIFDYGNTPRWDFADKPFGWYASAPLPRYSTNYVGLRNRISILSEAMSHLPFEDRVGATYRFIRLILEKIAGDSARVVELTRRADLQVTTWGAEPQKAPELGVRFEFASRGREKVLLDRSETPEMRDRRPKNRPPGPPEDVVEFETQIFDRFKATRTRRFPSAYLFTENVPPVVELLARHGIVVERTRSTWRGPAESFKITAIDRAERTYQGHKLLRLEGTFVSQEVTIPAGSCIVRTAQPLGILAFQLLEPESLDGVAAWNLLDAHLQLGRPYPIVKCHQKIPVPTENWQ